MKEREFFRNIAAVCFSGPLLACMPAKNHNAWDTIDYQRAARSQVYSDYDAYYSLPSVVTCGGGDDDTPAAACK